MHSWHRRVVTRNLLPMKKPGSTAKVLNKRPSRTIDKLTGQNLKSHSYATQKITEWVWEDHLAPAVVFLTDDIVCLGGMSASLTVMDFLSRRALYRCKRDANAEAKAEFEAANSPNLLNPLRRAGESSNEALTRHAERLRATLCYEALTLSPDATLLAGSRESCGELGQNYGEIDIWDMLDSLSPRLETTIPHKGSSLYLGQHVLAGPICAFLPGSDHVIVEDSALRSCPSRICIVEPRTGVPIKHIPPKRSPFNAAGSSFPPVRWLERIVPHPHEAEVAVRRVSSPMHAGWEIHSLSRARRMRTADWLGSGLVHVLPGTDRVLCCGNRTFQANEPPSLEVWDWSGSKIQSTPTSRAYPNLITTSADNRFIVVVSTSTHVGRLSDWTAMARERNDMLVEVFSLKDLKMLGQAHLQLGKPLAARVTPSGQIRLVSYVRFVPFNLIQCRLTFWTIDIT